MTGLYKGTNATQLERVNVYYTEANGGKVRVIDI